MAKQTSPLAEQLATSAAANPAPPMSIFDRHTKKSALVNRVFRALKDATDDDMRRDIIREVSSLAGLIGAKE